MKNKLSPPPLFFLLAVVLCISALSQISSDLYLPSLPGMAKSLNVNDNQVQWTLSLYMIGFCLAQLTYGPLSDAFGRKRPLLTGLTLSVLCSGFCLFAPTFVTVYFGRFIPGIGAGAGLVLARSILRDYFQDNTLAKYNSYLSVSGFFILSSAPLIGSFIEMTLGWRYNFAFLLVYSVLTLSAYALLIPESNQHLHPENIRPSTLKKNIGQLLRSTTFLRYAMCPLFSYAGVLSWLTAGPILLQQKFHLSPMQFAIVYVLAGTGFLIGGLTNSQAVKKTSIDTMMRLGFSIQFIAGLYLLLIHFTHLANPYTITPGLFGFMLGASFVFPNATAGAFGPFKAIAGTASAVFSFMQVLGGAMASSVIALSHENNVIPIAIAFVSMSLLAHLWFFLLPKPQS